MSFSRTIKVLAVCATVALSTASTVHAGGKHKKKNHNYGNHNYGYVYGDNGSCIDPHDYFNHYNNNDCGPDYQEPPCEPPTYNPCDIPKEPECPPPAVPLPAAASSSMLMLGLMVVGGLGRKALKLARN